MGAGAPRPGALAHGLPIRRVWRHAKAINKELVRMHQLLSKQPRLIIKSAYLIQITDPSLRRSDLITFRFRGRVYCSVASAVGFNYLPLQQQGLFFLRFGDGLKLFLYVREGSGSFRLFGLDNVADRNTIVNIAVNVL